ncbi:MAG TPA: 4-(cytidine 5'-diphospho)-2-C-methyl-D-erythritol kinase [Lachnospiraceae bacterium]|nr:4-(cytidine 5'-diphospho)-2-C-methyl-D-erythritol kinase [Lachnospiraceae bacterium]
MDQIKLKAYAKINLSLDVTGRRDNGYHDVRMIMQTIDLFDEITLSREEKVRGDDRIVLESESGEVAPDKNNLIYKTAGLIMNECGIYDGVKIYYRKNIPVAAGMAGGSTDAAAVLRGMNELFSLGLSDGDLCEMGVRIGADVPYCIIGGTALSEGIGEILTPLAPMPDCSLLIAKPPIGVSTAYVYNAFDSLTEKYHPDVDAMKEAIENKNIRDIAKLLGNSLEGVTIKEYPIIDKIKSLMLGNGAIGALMSGSGPTVFGIFDDMIIEEKAKTRIREEGAAKDLLLTKPFNIKR